MRVGRCNLTSSADGASAVTAYTYDLADRMTSTTPPGESATTYGLDALGRIASRTRPGEATETYGFIGTSETVWRIDDGTTVTEAAIDAAGSRIATKTGSALGYALFDLHGSIAAVSDAATDIDTALRYDAWGEITATASGSIPTPWRYQGLLDVSPDADNPLYDMGARFYAPGLGAFTQFDTYAGQAQNPLSMNRFLYAHANPATLVDPTGHFVPSCDASAYDNCSMAAYKGNLGTVTNDPKASTGKGAVSQSSKASPPKEPDEKAGGAVPTHDSWLIDPPRVPLEQLMNGAGSKPRACDAFSLSCPEELRLITPGPMDLRDFVDWLGTAKGQELTVRFVTGVVKGAAIAIGCTVTGTCLVLGALAMAAGAVTFVATGEIPLPQTDGDWAEFLGGFAGAAIGGVGASAASQAVRPAAQTVSSELWYRAMSTDELALIQSTGRLTLRQTEMFVTMDQAYVKQLAARHPELYEVIVEFQMKAGTRDALISIGARGPGSFADPQVAGLPPITRGLGSIVHIKSELGTTTFGLRAGSIEAFNCRIIAVCVASPTN